MIHCQIPAYVYWTFLPHRLRKKTSFLSVLLCLMKGLGFLEVLCKYLNRNIWLVCSSLKWTSSSEVGPFILARICSLIFVSSHKAKYLYSIPSKYIRFSAIEISEFHSLFSTIVNVSLPMTLEHPGKSWSVCLPSILEDFGLFYLLLGCISWNIGQDFSSYCDIGNGCMYASPKVQQIWSRVKVLVSKDFYGRSLWSCN